MANIIKQRSAYLFLVYMIRLEPAIVSNLFNDWLNVLYQHQLQNVRWEVVEKLQHGHAMAHIYAQLETN